MLILRTVITATGSLVVLFLLAKLMGNRQITHLTLFDYVSSITIGSIAAELATSPWSEAAPPLAAMVIYAVITAVIAVITNKSIGARRVITGRSLLLLDNGQLIRENFRKARLDINEFLTLCRVAGYFDIAELQCAVLEPSGDVSFLPKASLRPATPKDMSIPVPASAPAVTVIADGTVLTGNLSACDKSQTWLASELKKAGVDSPRDVFYAAVNSDNKLEVYVKLATRMDRDIFG